MMETQRLALILLFGGAAVVGLLALIIKTDIGQAIADAIRHNSGANEGAGVRREIEQMQGDLERLRVELERLRGELDSTQAQLLESGERLDFAERLLVDKAQGGGSAGGGPVHAIPQAPIDGRSA